MPKLQIKLWVGLLVMALLTPLGLWLPDKFKAGEAWGEWGTDSLARLIGYVPQGLQRMSELWKAPLPDYSVGGEQSSLTLQLLSYWISGIVGILIVGAGIYVLSRLIIKNGK